VFFERQCAKASAAILGTIAKQERVRISERVRAGMTRARAQGTRSDRAIGRPKVIFSRVKVVELRTQGKSWRQIAHECGAGAATVRRAYREWAASDPARDGDSELRGQFERALT
jgi:DNA invertase Pin-like site-specific DNA recombinase